MTRFRVAPTLFLALGIAAGCGRGVPSATSASASGSVPFKLAGPRQVGLGQGNVEKPEMAVAKPSDKTKVRPRELVECEVELRVKDDGDLPSEMYATFYSGQTSNGRFYLQPKGKTPDGVYHFSAGLDAPKRKGLYNLRGEAKYSIVGGAEPKVVRFETKDVTLEVE